MGTFRRPLRRRRSYRRLTRRNSFRRATNRKRRLSRVVKNYRRKNMTSLITKGTFNWETNDDSQARLGVNHNGIPNATDVQHGVICIEDNAGTMHNVSFAGVTASTQALYAANNGLFLNRRIAWVKMTFFPVITEIPALIEGTTLKYQANRPVFICHDSNGQITSFTSITVPQMLVNLTGVKQKSMLKQFKVFRKSRKFPAFQKYAALPQAGTVDNMSTPSGAWHYASDLSILGSTFRHTSMLLDLDATHWEGGDVFTVVFEIKYQWCDRRQ
nr:hypothetical protein [Bidens cyclovirus-like]